MLLALCIVLAIIVLYQWSPSWFQPVKDLIDSGLKSLHEGYRVREFPQMGIAYEPYRTREFQQRGITSTTIDGQYQRAALAGRI